MAKNSLFLMAVSFLKMQFHVIIKMIKEITISICQFILQHLIYWLFFKLGLQWGNSCETLVPYYTVISFLYDCKFWKYTCKYDFEISLSIFHTVPTYRENMETFCPARNVVPDLIIIINLGTHWNWWATFKSYLLTEKVVRPHILVHM